MFSSIQKQQPGHNQNYIALLEVNIDETRKQELTSYITVCTADKLPEQSSAVNSAILYTLA